MTMEKITGNFLTQPNKDFPLDCETLDYQQQLVALATVIGNIAGDRVVLLGCAANEAGTHRAAGYVFVRTADYPEGEVLPWEGGPVTSGMYVKQESVRVSANYVDYPSAYTRRSLAPGIGAENFSWEDFTDIHSITELMKENQELHTIIDSHASTPLGMVELWAGKSNMIPKGYVLCDGRELDRAEYPALYAILGDQFNAVADAAGNRYTTNPGYFRVPDLRGRFVVGWSDTDSDYAPLGQTGGMKKVQLSEDEIPAHSHRENLWRQTAINFNTTQGGSQHNVINGSGTALPDLDTESTGGDMAHENRPPYYVLAYIMRAK